jgi:hypothetical protein
MVASILDNMGQNELLYIGRSEALLISPRGSGRRGWLYSYTFLLRFSDIELAMNLFPENYKNLMRP